MKKNDFLDSLKLPQNTLEKKCNTHSFLPAYYSGVYNLFKSDKYIEFTDLVFSIIGSEIERFFPDINSELIYRIKSKSSYTNKTSIHHDLLDNNSDSPKTQIFDTYGMKLVINGVPLKTEAINIISKDLEEKEKKLVTHPSDELAKKVDELKYLKNIYDTRINTYKGLCKVERQYEKFAKTNNISAQEHFKEKLKLYNSQLENLKNKSDYYMAKYMFEYVLENSETLHELGITQQSNRRKSVDKENGYKAEHYGLQSKYLPHWCSEFQTKSYYRNTLATYGTASHDLGTSSHKNSSNSKEVNQIFINKKRKIPEILSSSDLKNKNKVDDFIHNEVLCNVPNFTIYVKKGIISRFSDCDNFFHFYSEELIKEPTKYDFYDKILNKHNGLEYLPNIKEVFNNLENDDLCK